MLNNYAIITIMTNQQVFLSYTNQFDLNHPRIKLKIDHSLRVMELAKQLASDLGLDEDGVLLAEEIGLLHDIGRFEQVKKFAQDDDAFGKDMLWDHGDNGARLLFDLGLIKQFKNISPSHWPIIEAAIKNHNKLDIEARLDPTNLLHCQIIRDADKLDIFQALLDEEHERNFQPEAVSQDSRRRFFKQQLITQTDKDLNCLRTLAFVFDLNFDFSFAYLNKHQLLTKLFENSPNQDELREYYQFAQNFVNQKIA